MTTDQQPLQARHLRVGPGMNVSPCGARGPFVKFAYTVAQATCDRCVEMRRASTERKIRRLAAGKAARR